MKLVKAIGMLALAQASLMAHTGVGTASGFAAGFGHPIGGLDHVLAMVAVGLWAVQMGGRSLWAVPAAFVGMMIVGGFLGASGVAVPFIEAGILASVIVLGGLIASGVKVPAAAGAVIVGVFAIFHGHAHGAEMPVDAGGLMYGAGFALATALLHGTGIAAGMGLSKVQIERMVRMSGGAIAAGGVALALV
jgi:urease accessory protein